MSTSQPDLFDILVQTPVSAGSMQTTGAMVSGPTSSGLGISVPGQKVAVSGDAPHKPLSHAALNNNVIASAPVPNSQNEELGGEGDDTLLDMKKGVKSEYVFKLRTKGKTCFIDEVVPEKFLPISIKSSAAVYKNAKSPIVNNTTPGKLHRRRLSQQQYQQHNRTASHNSIQSYGSLKHGNLKPRTRMLASEIDTSELPDSKLSHEGLGKTKIPTNPDAEIIAVTDQLRKLTQRPLSAALDDREGGGLNRLASVRSARGFGRGEDSNFRLFIANPDNDSD
ncbi:unnamed protein product [Ambrosiozyma monospora]|uniref:Unnamed protein product n=2 Tax=Ambrosiozyma monospora TaxID=43982 RepID=A0ACB5U2D2_AMBMO|nr:unnamed protein product [Ambrosiozyma monospora]